MINHVIIAHNQRKAVTLMKCSYWFEDSTTIFTDYELSVREMNVLMRKHGFLVGYTTKDGEVVIMEDMMCGYHL